MENIQEVPESIDNHLKGLLSSTDNPDLTIEDLKVMWSEKEKLFERQTKSLGMIEQEKFEADDERGVILLTYSGSLISIYSANNNLRKIEYASIKMRSDVPDVVVSENTSLEDTIAVGSSASFTKGEVKKTSAIYKLFSFHTDIPLSEQNNRIREATIFLTNGFIKINRTFSLNTNESPDQFNFRSIVRYIAGKNNLSQKQTREILEDYISILETGLMLSERVSLGSIGNLHSKIKKAQSAKVMKVPSTGEEVTVAAKPEMYVPKISFSKNLKQKVSEIEIAK